MNWIKTRWKKIDKDPKTVRNFGLILAGILFTLGLLALLRGHAQYRIEWPLSMMVVAFTFQAPKAMGIFYQAWMLVAEGISWVLLRIILAVLFYFVLTPLGAIIKLTEKDLLDEKIDRGAKSYWQKRSHPVAREQYEKLF